MPVGDAEVLVRVWVEQHDGVLRGRLLLPDLTGPRTARGVDELAELVRRALQQLQDDFAT